MRLAGAWTVAIVLLAGTITSAWADALDDAKAAGLIGERPDGYVAAVEPNPSPDIVALIKKINAKRRSAYETIAQQENVAVEQVGALTAEKIKRQAPPGHYFMAADGRWEQN
jgi:uncharacterized protein YdbL (DUF1318 family)